MDLYSELLCVIWCMQLLFVYNHVDYINKTDFIIKI